MSGDYFISQLSCESSITRVREGFSNSYSVLTPIPLIPSYAFLSTKGVSL